MDNGKSLVSSMDSGQAKSIVMFYRISEKHGTYKKEFLASGKKIFWTSKERLQTLGKG